MANTSNCLQLINSMSQQDQDAILARLDQLQARGLTAAEAQLQAAIDVLAQVEREGQGEPSILKSVDRPQFYSQLQRAIEGVPERLSNMGAAAWKQWLEANASKLGVKKDEIEWSGIKDFLDLQGKAKLSKDELAAYLDDSGVRVGETVLGKRSLYVKMTDAGYDLIDRESGSVVSTHKYHQDAVNAATDALKGDDKYSQYTLPGGKNYRELLITLPSGDAAKVARRAELAALDRERPLTAAEQAEYDGLTDFAKGGNTYRSNHWDEANVLAHIRVNDRTDADGNKVLFVEELQSDWGQDGKKKGFFDDSKLKGFKFDPMTESIVEASDGEAHLWEYDGTEVPLLGGGDRSQAQASVTQRMGAIPTAPFVTKTEGWLNLALKRIAMMAVEGGYDKVAFVNGEQSADRYDLSKSISAIDYRKSGDDNYRIRVYDQVGQPVSMHIPATLDADGLEEYVGKEMAAKIVKQATSDEQSLTGLDLKVGGEGMKAFYDQIVPQAISKLLPKIGGEKMGAVTIGGSDKLRKVRDDDGTYALEEKRFDEYDEPYWEAIAFGLTEKRAAEVMQEDKRSQQPGFDVTDKMRETVSQGVPLFSRDREAPDTPEFKKWFGDSKTVDASGKPIVFYRGQSAAFNKGQLKGRYFTSNPAYASTYDQDSDVNVLPVYIKAQNIYQPNDVNDVTDDNFDEQALLKQGYDAIATKDMSIIVPLKSDSQIKSAVGNNGEFDANNPSIIKSSDRPYFDDLANLKVTTNYKLGDLLKTSKKLSWWDRTIGTPYNLAQKHPQFKRVFDAVQRFIGDVSAYATRAADLAPSILPKLETWKDIGKTPLSAADVKALRDPIFGGTLNYTRDAEGNLIEAEDVSTAGVVFTNEELRDKFGLNDRQIGLYREFRRATNKSLSDLAVSDMLRYLGTDGEGVRQRALDAKNLDGALNAMVAHLDQLIEQQPKRAEVLENTKKAIKEKAGQAIGLMARGYAPLSRFGQYTVDVVDANGERLYFSMFENERDANKMASEMKEQYPDAAVETGVMSQESYKLFSGVTPETLALFGESLGLEESSDDAKSQIFQEYLKAAKTSRSAMKRLIQRKGINGFSEDAGRVLAGFVYSNARQISTNLHAGEIGRSAQAINQNDGDVKDAAIKLMEYVQNPREEAQALRGLMFTNFIGGSIASAMVNLTQPFTMTMPYLSQFAGAAGSAKLMADAVKLASRGIRNDDELKAALKKAEDEGVVSPQEVHQLMAQAQGKGALQSGDGTKMGDAAAKVNNAMAKLGLGWGKVFSAAEQFNRRVTFIAAYKLARDQGMADPMAFAEQAIAETQGVYNKGNKPAWARGAVGSTLFTFKQFSIGYVEFLRRMWGNGPEGKKAVGLALGVLFLMSGMGGMPGADDLDDVVDGFAQRVLGRSFDTKQAKKEFFASILGQSGAEFVMSGISGLPGMPIDVAGRMGLGNLVPGTGLFTKKRDYGRDYLELAGPAGTMFTNAGTSLGQLVQGNFKEAALASAPVAVQNAYKAKDMAEMGFYRDQKGRKVVDTDGYDMVAKAMGFQPRAVAQVQEATGVQSNLITQNKLRETEIADRWAAGRIEKDQSKIDEAKQMLADWNRNNPGSKISIDAAQINKRVIEANKSKAQRIAATAPKELRAAVKKELQPAE